MRAGMRHKAVLGLGLVLFTSLIFATLTEAQASQPTLTSVSIDSDNATSIGANETATVGDTVSLMFTADETIQVPTVAFTVGGASATGSVTVTPTNWTAIAAGYDYFYDGYDHTVALKSGGTLWAWGRNVLHNASVPRASDPHVSVQVRFQARGVDCSLRSAA
jgi:hypothetical protein